MSEVIQVFGHPVEVVSMKVHATAVGDGFLLTLIASNADEDVIFATTVGDAAAAVDDLSDLIATAGKEFRAWAGLPPVEHSEPTA